MTSEQVDTRTGGTVLVVEDESELRFVLRAHLLAAGFKTLEAADGRQAIEVATEHIPDVIIMDLGLPIMGGEDATRALKADARTSHIPIIMLTARASPDDVVRGLDAGAQEYVPKPFDMMELLARVQTVSRLATANQNLDRLNTKLEAEVDAKTRRLQVLYEFMRDLNHADAREQILDLIIRCVGEMTGAQRISLLLKDSTGDHLICERAVGIDAAEVEPLRVDAVQGIAGRVFKSGKTFAAKAIGSGNEREQIYRRDVFMSTPLVSTALETQEGVIGVLNVTERSEDVPFSDEEIECIRSIADAGAIALTTMIRRDQLQRSVRILIQTVGRLAEYRDEETTVHLERVTRMARILACELRRRGPYASLVHDDFIESLVQAAPMHDIGKVGIPDEILTKPGKLTDEEFQIMKTHTDIGRRVLSQALDRANPVPLLQMCIDIAYAHHERYDSTGYPRRIAGQDIPLAARIIALVDAYDAITSRRRYKDAQSHEEAAAIIESEAGKHFDPVLVDAFLRCQEQFDAIRERHNDDAALPAGTLA